MAESFAERWYQKCGEPGYPVSMVSCGDYLLPDPAAPFLSFKEAERPKPIWEVFSPSSNWTAEDRCRLAPYRMIGSDGAGNPICLEQGSGMIWLLDHEDWFRSIEFVNSSVQQLAECLVAYMGEKEPERFRDAVRAIDQPALKEGSFWWHEAASIAVEI